MKNQRIIPRLHILNRLNLLRGSIVEGTVERSVVSRRVHLHQGSEVRSSLLFPGVVIHENAIVEHAILDKGCRSGCWCDDSWDRRSTCRG